MTHMNLPDALGTKLKERRLEIQSYSFICWCMTFLWGINHELADKDNRGEHEKSIMPANLCFHFKDSWQLAWAIWVLSSISDLRFQHFPKKKQKERKKMLYESDEHFLWSLFHAFPWATRQETHESKGRYQWLKEEKHERNLYYLEDLSLIWQ